MVLDFCPRGRNEKVLAPAIFVQINVTNTWLPAGSSTAALYSTPGSVEQHWRSAPLDPGSLLDAQDTRHILPAALEPSASSEARRAAAHSAPGRHLLPSSAASLELGWLLLDGSEGAVTAAGAGAIPSLA